VPMPGSLLDWEEVRVRAAQELRRCRVVEPRAKFRLRANHGGGLNHDLQ